VDPVTHIVVPAAIALAARARREDAVLAGLGGILPDLENGIYVLFSFLPGSHYLLLKHGGTHTFVGAALVALAAALFLKDRRLRAFGFLLLGTWTQVALDIVTNPWGMRFLMPFSGYRIARLGFPWEVPLHVGLLLFAAVVIGWEVRRFRREKGSSLSFRL